MPIYEYKCDNDHVFDIMQKISDDPLTSCIECGAPVHKVLQPVSIAFKGSGFYSTDYGRSNGSRSSSEKSSGNGSDSKSTGSSDTTGTKPQAKKDD
ncbi:FmdB family zinc ribbon protein [Rubrobacter calidifluminis]|uniref:FmdB family zinc ribbon protein n=1 Tax=Rubrobacter calidifluminis TaxID=1392640 RepID=UPI00236040C1|nr:FmdB family zinc ribbon protein [Rubrobacter calidifluminis]